jgi:hypothetical protein
MLIFPEDWLKVTRLAARVWLQILMQDNQVHHLQTDRQLQN